MANLVLGLDVSTSCTGVCIVDKDIELDDKGSHILLLDKVEFKKCKTFWEKADVVESVLSDILHRQKIIPTVFALEEPLVQWNRLLHRQKNISGRPNLHLIITRKKAMWNKDATNVHRRYER